MRLLGNLVAFQAGWFACVLGAANGRYLLGPAVVAAGVALHLALSEDRTGQTLLLAAAAVLGLVVETALSAIGATAPARDAIPSPLPPLWLIALWPNWLIALWPNFGAALPVSLRFLRGKTALSAVLGAVAGPGAYYGGARLGALSFPGGDGFGLALLAVVWAVSVPLLVRLSERVEGAGQPLLTKR
ncbi:MAG: hypothetical protein H6Q79_2999 [Deltaproteobacteria bacterium]|nr:hypothetical protein [Deltaproteobacteria bacterium]